MADDTQKKQPTILVKKADGTTARVSLAEFRVMRAGGSGTSLEGRGMGDEMTVNSEQRTVNSGDTSHDDVMNIIPEPHVDSTSARQHDSTTALEPVDDIPEMHDEIIHAKSTQEEVDDEKILHSDNAIPEIAPPHELTTTKPVDHYFEDLASVSSGTTPTTVGNFDTTSLLEEDLSEVKAFEKQGARHVTHADIARHDVQVQQHAETSDDAPRLASLIASWKKGIRSDEQFITQATKSREAGGVGLTEDKATTLLGELKKGATHGAGVSDAVPGKRVSDTPTITPSIQMSAEGRGMRSETPVVETLPSNESSSKHVTNVSSPRNVFPLMNEKTVDAPYEIKPLQQMDHAQPRNMMADVSSGSEMRTMGPEEEISRFGLEDFRRLSRDAMKAGEMLYAKFENWKKDDYLLFMNAREAWHKSPLFRLYVSIATDALNNGTAVKDVLRAGKSGLSDVEYMALVEVNKSLSS